MFQNGRALWLMALLGLFIGFSSCKNDDMVEVDGVVFFTIDTLQEIENATDALPINIAIENAEHMGGIIELRIDGGTWGEDYETNTDSASFTLEVNANALSAGFTIIPIDDEKIESDLELTVNLVSASGGLKLGAQTSMTITILDDDEPTISLIGFEKRMDSLAEEATESLTVNIDFDKPSTNGGNIMVEASGTGVFGTDYTIDGAGSGSFSLTVNPGDSTASFDISAIDNADFAENKIVDFVLTSVSGGLRLMGSDSVTVVIVNDDQPIIPVVDFGTGIADSLDETGGSVSIPLAAFISSICGCECRSACGCGFYCYPGE